MKGDAATGAAAAHALLMDISDEASVAAAYAEVAGQAIGDDPVIRAGLVNSTMLRPGTAADVEGIMVFLASDDSAYAPARFSPWTAAWQRCSPGYSDSHKRPGVTHARM
ncbi:hypothetical protein [Arthrobacter sp. B6]|uniref:hypothetical protein n=1 Tax=Arthrobacter sp. B6 TaxID=1570137 RepID=UPI000A73D215|nr:hypothetical protein [Arthrobacter sp. B6]